MKELRKDSQIFVIPATSAQACVSQAERIVHLIIDEDQGSHSLTHQDTDRIPWHISNRYYDVDVHFKISHNEALRPIRSIGSSSKSRLAPRQARLKSEVLHRQEKEDDNTLDQKARDIFATLELGPPPASRDAIVASNSRNTDTGLMDSLREDVRNVQAVIIIVDRDQSLTEHRKLIDRLSSKKDDIPLLSGFDLAISLIVALPSPLNDASGPTTFTSISHSAEVEDLYAGEGWEYVDLAKVVSEDYDNMLGADEQDEQLSSHSDEHEDDEKQGIERLREALMTHAWPGLERKQDRKRASSSIQSGGLPALNGHMDDNLTRTLESLRLDLDAIDEAGMTQPTEKDEELARLFMAKIQAAQEAGVGRDVHQNGRENTTQTGDRSVADMQTALEEFLESNEPGLFYQQSKQMNTRSDEAWAVNDAQDNFSGKQEAFDDDFTDFVQEGSTQSMNGMGTTELDSLDEDDLGFIGDTDDAFLLRALSEQEKSRRGNNGQSKATDSTGFNIDFESTLQAVLAQAERVRAIPNHDQRREEAAKVALALLDQ